MDVSSEPSKTFMNPPPTKRWRKSRRGLTGFVVGLILIGLFYTEENWRGRRAWENCQRALRASGVELNWAHYIPAPVPDDENVLGSPEMERWFKGGNLAGWKDLVKKLPSPSFAGLHIDSNTARMFVAEATIGLPGMPAPAGSAMLRWDDPASRTEAARLLTNALGPTAAAPQSSIGVGLMLRAPEEVQAARIFLQCQTAPTEKDLQKFLPDSVLHASPELPEAVLKFEPDGDRSYRVTMPVLARVADFLAWSDGLAPQFAFIQQALQRPFSRITAYYGNPTTIPAPNSISTRNLVQILAARAQCHFLLGQPEEALRELTFVHDFCRRIFEEEKPMTFTAAMLNAAVRGLYITVIADGLRLQSWREPQLVALQEQLKTINLLSPVKQAFEIEAVGTFHSLENSPSAGLVKRSFLGGLFPRGWGYQKMAARVNLHFELVTTLDSTSQTMRPDKIESVNKKTRALDDWSPYTVIGYLTPPDFTRVCQRAALSQTEVSQALIACALERYHLARGEFPENLHALVPQFLDKIPLDVIGGQPPHYRRAADGTFALYSTGWSGQDHGGSRGQSPQSMEGDWVWPD